MTLGEGLDRNGDTATVTALAAVGLMLDDMLRETAKFRALSLEQRVALWQRHNIWCGEQHRIKEEELFRAHIAPELPDGWIEYLTQADWDGYWNREYGRAELVHRALDAKRKQQWAAMTPEEQATATHRQAIEHDYEEAHRRWAESEPERP